jgi:hypothetical protein
MAEEKQVQEEQPGYVNDLLSANEKIANEKRALQEEVERIKNDNRALVEKLLNGEEVTKEEDTTTIDELAEILYGEKCDQLSDIEYIDKTCKLRRKVIKEKGFDPFVGRGKKYVPEPDEAERAENVARVFEECVEYANGDNQLFIQELQRRTVDIPIPFKNRR